MDECYAGCGLCSAAFVAMMKSADLRQGDDLALLGHLDRARFGAIHSERQVSSRPIGVLDVPPRIRLR